MILTRKNSLLLSALIFAATLLITAGATYVLEIPRSVYTILGPAIILMSFALYEALLLYFTGLDTLNETISELDYQTIYSLTR